MSPLARLREAAQPMLGFSQILARSCDGQTRSDPQSIGTDVSLDLEFQQ